MFGFTATVVEHCIDDVIHDKIMDSGRIVPLSSVSVLNSVLKDVFKETLFFFFQITACQNQVLQLRQR